MGEIDQLEMTAAMSGAEIRRMQAQGTFLWLSTSHFGLQRVCFLHIIRSPPPQQEQQLTAETTGGGQTATMNAPNPENLTDEQLLLNLKMQLEMFDRDPVQFRARMPEAQREMMVRRDI